MAEIEHATYASLRDSVTLSQKPTDIHTYRQNTGHCK